MPIAAAFATRPSASITASVARPPAIGIGAPPSVNRLNVSTSSSSRRPTTADSGSPPPSGLPSVTASATTPLCWNANILPVRPRPILTSSNTSQMPCRSHSSRSAGRKFAGGTTSPPSDCTASTMIAAVSAAGETAPSAYRSTCSRHFSEQPSRLHGPCRQRYGSGYGTFVTLPPPITDACAWWPERAAEPLVVPW